MKGACTSVILVFLLSLLPVKSIFAVGEVAGAVAAGTVHAAAASAAAKTQYAASASNIPPSKAPKTGGKPPPEPETGYYEFVGGFGLAQVIIGKSFIGVTPTETDLLYQFNYRAFRSGVFHAGIGYLSFLNASERYFCKKTWFPSIEPILNLYYFNLTAKGHVFLFNNPGLSTSTFNMPIKTTSLMIDVLLNVVSYRHFTLFVLGGVGESWSQINYTDSPNATGLIRRPPLHLNTRSQSNMLYEWGAGISYAVNPDVKLAVEYLYTHIGNFRTSGTGRLGGIPSPGVAPAGFSLRTQALFLDAYVSLCL